MRLISMNCVDLEKSRVTNDADEMISWINSLTVDGGGDCPEYSLSGLITGNTNQPKFTSIYSKTFKSTNLWTNYR